MPSVNDMRHAGDAEVCGRGSGKADGAIASRALLRRDLMMMMLAYMFRIVRGLISAGSKWPGVTMFLTYFDLRESITWY